MSNTKKYKVVSMIGPTAEASQPLVKVAADITGNPINFLCGLKSDMDKVPVKNGQILFSLNTNSTGSALENGSIFLDSNGKRLGMFSANAKNDGNGNEITTSYVASVDFESKSDKLLLNTNNGINAPMDQVTVPAASSTASGIITAGAQEIGGEKTLSSLLKAHGGISLDSSTEHNVAPTYLLGIKGFAEGGNIVWDTASSVKVGYANEAEKAIALKNPQTIGITGAAYAAPTLFDGTYDIDLEITKVKEAYLSWGGKNFSGSYGPIDAAMIPELGANRLEFFPGSKVEIEYSEDKGKSWNDYQASEAAKTQLFSSQNFIGVGDKAKDFTDLQGNNQLRITLNTSGSVYSVLNKFCIYVSTNGSEGAYCTISYAKTGSDDFIIAAEKVPISGWSGYNIINTSSITIGNGKPDHWSYGRLRFTFGHKNNKSTTYKGISVYKIWGFGGVGWSTPSNMASTGHLYSYDYNQNATFPANITAPRFIGKADNALKADSALKISDGGMSLYAQYNNEINFGGTNASSTIYFGYRASDSKPIPTNFVFGGSGGAATITAATFNGNSKTATALTTSAGSNHQAIYFSNGKPAALDLYCGNSSVGEHDANNMINNGFYYYRTNGPSGLGEQSADGAMYVQAYSSAWVGQIAQDYRNGNLFTRSKKNGTWQSWQKIATTNEVNLLEGRFNNLEIGGRNYILHSLYPVPFNTQNEHSTQKGYYEFCSYDIGREIEEIEDGTPCIISFDLDMIISAKGKKHLQIYNSNYPGEKSVETISFDFTATPDSNGHYKTRIEYPITVSSNTTPRYPQQNFIEFYSGYDTNSHFKITHLQLEIGNKATKWHSSQLENAGGKNLLNLKSVSAGGKTTVVLDGTGIQWDESITSDTYFYINSKVPLNAYAGQTMTLSFFSNKSSSRRFALYNNSDKRLLSPTINKGLNVWTFQIPQSVAEDLKILVDDHFRPDNGSGTVILSNFKLEKGNKATDWTPAPEDMLIYTNGVLAKHENGYYGLALSDGSDPGYFRTPKNGLIPWSSSNGGYLGTSGWQFSEGYIKNIHSTSVTATTFTGALKGTADKALTLQATKGTADLYRNVWFSDSAGIEHLGYNDQFQYNPNLNNLRVGSIELQPDKKSIDFRSDDANYRSGALYSTGGSGALSFINKYSKSSIIFKIGSDPNEWGASTWSSSSPDVLIKSRSLYVNTQLGESNPTHNFYVTGTSKMTDSLTLTENTKALLFREGNSSYKTGIYYGTAGNEALSFVTKSTVTSFMFITGSDLTEWGSSTWNSTVPTLQIKNKSVYINELIASGTTPAYNFSVKGTANITGDLTTNSISCNDNYILHPEGGSYRTTSSVKTGMLTITLPSTNSNTMLRFNIEIYDYKTFESTTYTVGGYNYSSGWHSTFAYCNSHYKSDKRNLNVRFGESGGKDVIYIGEPDTRWNYPQISISNISIGYSGATLSKWNKDWGIDFTTTAVSELTIDSTHINTNVAIKSKMMEYANATAAGYRNVWMSNIDDSTQLTQSTSLQFDVSNGRLKTTEVSLSEKVILTYENSGANIGHFGFRIL